MKTIFNSEYFPTPAPVIEEMLLGLDLNEKVVLEPSAGSGHIVEVCQERGVNQVLAFEELEDLRAILGSKCKVIGEDFLQCRPEQVSHVDFIIMNPPFSSADKHILHAWEVAPEGCQIVALCNYQTLQHAYTRSRRELEWIINDYGAPIQNLGPVFKDAERTTGVDIGLVKITKPVVSDQSKFEGFYLDADEEFGGQEGLMPYNEVRDIVMRYVGALKAFDQFKESADVLNAYLKPVGMGGQIGIEIRHNKTTLEKEEFAKEVQKRSWKWIIDKMNITKFVTSGVLNDINKFVEQQTKIPFTMKNIYHMMDMIIQTRSQTMDRAIIEVFDRITMHHHENRYQVEGWKTNSHYLVGKKFIFDWVVQPGYNGQMSQVYNSRGDKMEDLHKALCYLTGKPLGETLHGFFHRQKPKEEWEKQHRPEYERRDFATWYDWGFFQIKGFKKGTLHVKFKDDKVWALFNQRVAKIKGYPLPENL